MKMARRGAIAGFLLSTLLIQGCTTAGGTQDVASAAPTPLAVYGATMVVELAPVHVAVKRRYGEAHPVKLGGAFNLVNPDNKADMAANAETQLLRSSLTNPDGRIIMTIVDGNYRMVARRSAGIASLADLKGKRIATMRGTSAEFFVHKMLQQVGLTDADVTIVSFTSLQEMAPALEKREVDAVGIWEPFSENALRAVGADGIEFSGHGIYREHYNLYATASGLADPAKRREIVALTREIIKATREMVTSPAEGQATMVRIGNYTPEEIARSWHHHGWVAAPAADMLDVLFDEEQWLAAKEKRQPRTREQLAVLIDTSVHAEAVKGLH